MLDNQVHPTEDMPTPSYFILHQDRFDRLERGISSTEMTS
jgi:hypothetical protein